MAPRKSKTPRRSKSHSDISSAITSAATAAASRTKTNWSKVDSSNFNGFGIKYLRHFRPRGNKHTKPENVEAEDSKTGQKRKLLVDQSMGEDLENSIQRNPFEGAPLPDIEYVVTPPEMWEDTVKYRKFTVNLETFSVNEYLFVRADDNEDPDPAAPVQGWVAKVLEVKAGDVGHVYLRVFWMYRPEDLPGGRQPYHGRNELIASNDMQIIDATTIQGRASVMHWVEQDDGNELLDRDTLFWRQSLDITKNRKLSSLRLHCKDKVPCNPDKLLIQCSHCKSWLHGPCLENEAILSAYKTNDVPCPGDEEEEEVKLNDIPTTPVRRTSSRIKIPRSTPQSTPRQSSSKRRKSKVAAALELVKSSDDLLFSAQLTGYDDTDPSIKTQMEISDLRPGQERTWVAPVKCLLCAKKIEEDGTESAIAVADQVVKDESPNKAPSTTSVIEEKAPEKQDSMLGDEESASIRSESSEESPSTSSEGDDDDDDDDDDDANSKLGIKPPPTRNAELDTKTPSEELPLNDARGNTKGRHGIRPPTRSGGEVDTKAPWRI